MRGRWSRRSASIRRTAYELLARGPEEMGVADDTRFAELWREARSIANREDFLHWEVAFPGVWHRWQESRPQGGFDAVIGNPPWDRIKLQEVEWFATRAHDLALAPTAAARLKGIQQLRDQGASLAAEFDAAKAQSESLSQMVRSGGDYPLLSGGDINLYSLFVERSMSLIKPDGFCRLADAVRHLRRQDSGPVLQIRFDQRTGGRPIRF